MNKKSNITKIGGMALFNGLLLRGSKRECVTEFINGKIKINIKNIEESNNKNILSKIPVIRGIYNVINTIISSVPYIMTSAKESTKNLLNEDEENINVTNVHVLLGIILAYFLILAFLIVIPNYISKNLFCDMNINFVQAIFQILVFGIYLLVLKYNKSLQSVFEYHGAEHKVVNAYENLKLEDINVASVKKESRFHKRCGGNFVVYLILLLLVSTFVISSVNLTQKTLLQIILFPVFIGIAYEIIYITDRLNGKFSYISYPAMLIQYITTKEPSDDKIQIAIYCLLGCTRENTDVILNEYIKGYIKNNLQNTEYIVNDIYRVAAKVKNISKEEIFLKLNTIKLTYQEEIYFQTLLDRMYKENIPLQYILGKQEFYNEIYEVNENVLIPRADTEVLVEKAIEYINKEKLEKMIDMCTGSGCVGISIAKNSNIKFGFLVDISMKALEVANKNNILNGTTNKLGILKSNLFDEFENLQENKYDIVVSNPPYIKTSVIDTLAKDVQNEPRLALDGGKDGLQVYKKIFSQAKTVLKDNGYLMLEIGYDQLEQITKIIEKDENYELVESVKDLNGNDRVVVCRFLQKLKKKF